MRSDCTFTRSLLNLPKATAGTSALWLALTGLPSAAVANAEPTVPADTPEPGRRTPNLILGGGVGYASHWGKAYEVDAVSGATTPVSSFSQHGVGASAFADFAALDLGPGNLGLVAGFGLSVPKTIMSAELEPRYRLRFPLMGASLRSVEPWAGLGLALAFREKIDRDYYVWFRFSAGCDLALASDRFYAGLAFDYDMGNPKGVKHSGQDQHMNSFTLFLRLSYLVF